MTPGSTAIPSKSPTISWPEIFPAAVNESLFGQDNRVRGKLYGQFATMLPLSTDSAGASDSAKLKESRANIANAKIANAKIDNAKKATEERRAAAEVKAKAAGKAF